jgi:hypothetical protein
MSRGGLYSGFAAYQVLGPDDLRAALRDGILAVDANVLLNLYRYNEQTVADLLGVLSAAKQRLFVPHQVILEFWRNRQSVVASLGSATRDTQSAFTRNGASTQDAVRRWAKSVALSDDLRDKLLEDVEEFFDGLRGRLGDEPAVIKVGTPTPDDSLLSKLEILLDGTVGAALSDEEWHAAVAEGERRVENSEPPGYMDADKLESDLPEKASGDYLVWKQLLEEGRLLKRDLVLVTSDTKEDWWNRAARGSIIGPRPELIGEYFDVTRCRFFLLEPADLLKYSSVLGVGTSEESLHDIERIQNEPPPRAPWTLPAVRAVLGELETQGHIQAEVIREAVQNKGKISRQRVYEIDGRDAGQMLRGFTRPVKRVTAELQARSVVPFGVVPLLRAVYESGVKSTHFAVPEEVVELLQTENHNSE